MKKYVISLLFLIAQNACAMEVIAFDAKALRFAKLFNKYPNGYSKNSNHIDVSKAAINYFLGKTEKPNTCFEEMYCREPRKDSVSQEYINAQNQKKQFFAQFESLSARVKQYQTILNNMEAVEILDFVYKYLPCEMNRNIFAAALRDHAQQYYAVSNALKFVILEPALVMATGYYSGVVNWYKPCFLAELHEDDRPTISFSDDGSMCTLHCLNPRIVKAYSIPGYKRTNLDIAIPSAKASRQIWYKKSSPQDLVVFVNKDSRKSRVDVFKILFAGWVEYLSNEPNKEKCTSAFIELLKRLNWHDIELSSEKDCKEVLKREDSLHNIGSWS